MKAMTNIAQVAALIGEQLLCEGSEVQFEDPNGLAEPIAFRTGDPVPTQFMETHDMESISVCATSLAIEDVLWCLFGMEALDELFVNTNETVNYRCRGTLVVAGGHLGNVIEIHRG